MNILVICKHCKNEIGLFDNNYITQKFKKNCKCNHCGNSEKTRLKRKTEYNKIKDRAEFCLEKYLGVNKGFEYRKEC